MQILSIRCGLTRNLGNYESAKLEVEAAPADGQTSAELLEEVKDYLEKAMPEVGAGSAKKPAAKKSASTSAPLAGKGKGKKRTKKEIAAAKKAEKAAVGTKNLKDWADGDGTGGRLEGDTSGGAPFDADVSDPAPAEKATPVEPTKDMARKCFESVVASEALEVLLARFNDFRDPGLGFRSVLTEKDWGKVTNKVQDCYKKLTTAESDADVMHDLVAAITGERNATK